MDILEIEEKRTLTREEAAKFLHQVADSLARHNDLEFKRDGLRYVVDVPKMVELETELEIGDDGSSFEIELKW